MQMATIEFHKILGAVVRYHRKKRGLTQRDLKGSSSGTLGHLEQGNNSPSISTLIKIAKDLEMKLSDLVADLERVEAHLLKKGCKPHKDGVSVKFQIEAPLHAPAKARMVGYLTMEYLRDEVAKCLR